MRTRQTQACESHRVGREYVFGVEVAKGCASQSDGVAQVGLAVTAGARACGNGSLQDRRAVDHGRGGAVVNLVSGGHTRHRQCLGRDAWRCGVGVLGQAVVACACASQTQACESHRVGREHVFGVEVAKGCASQAHGINRISLAVAAGARACRNGGLQHCGTVDHGRGGGVVHLIGR